MTVFYVVVATRQEALPVTRVSHGIDRVDVIFDEPNLVANAGLVLVATLTGRFGLEALIDSTVRLVGRVGGARPGRKVLTLVHAMIAGASHIDHADMLRAGFTAAVLSHRVMAPSTLGTFLRAFTFGHVRQLEAVIARAMERAWAAGAGPGSAAMTIDVDSTICDVHGKAKQGAAYGYTKTLGYHPLLATRVDTGEVLHARMRKGSANTQRGVQRFTTEVVARLRRAGASGPLTVRADAGFYSWELINTLNRLNVAWSITVSLKSSIRTAIAAIDEDDWTDITYPDGGDAQVAETTYVTGGYHSQRPERRVRLVVRRTRLTGTAQQRLWPTGATTPSSPTSTWPPSKPTSSTAATPPWNSPSATSKKEPDSTTSPPATSTPTRRGCNAPCSPTT